MKLISHGTNCHELVSNNGTTVLFSYETVVAVNLSLTTVLTSVSAPPKTYTGVYKTATKHSKTTSCHINQWTGTTQTLPQTELEELAARSIR